jgi:alkylhydroperoxidase family enzyme
LRLAAGMTKTPASVDEELFAALRRQFSEPQLVELATAIAWENYRSRFNRAFGVLAEGFSEGAFCPLAEP